MTFDSVSSFAGIVDRLKFILVSKKKNYFRKLKNDNLKNKITIQIKVNNIDQNDKVEGSGNDYDKCGNEHPVDSNNSACISNKNAPSQSIPIKKRRKRLFSRNVLCHLILLDIHLTVTIIRMILIKIICLNLLQFKNRIKVLHHIVCRHLMV